MKVINSAQGFPVEMVYKTKTAEIGSIGTVSAALPRPDMVVTESQWDVFLPEGVTYRAPETNMRLVVDGREVGPEALAEAAGQDNNQLRISVPMAGIQYSFAKLYANQGEDAARFSIPYASGGGQGLAGLLALLGTAMFWAGAFFLVRRHDRIPLRHAGGAVAAGVVITTFAVHFFGASGGTVIVTSLAAAAAIGIWIWAARPWLAVKRSG